MTALAFHAIIRGRVQGVAFRWMTRDEARARGLCGWVRNLADGSVEIHVEGAAEELVAMRSWLAEGPPSARVDSVEGDAVPLEGHTAFAVRH